MSEYEINSVKNAIADCDRFLAKEGMRSTSMPQAEFDALIVWHKAHRVKLVAMLAA